MHIWWKMAGSIEVSAPGKLILIGEYAVLEGIPAIVAAIDRRVIVSIRENNQREFTLSAPNLGIERQKFVPDANGNADFIGKLSPQQRENLRFFQSVFARTWRKSDLNKSRALDLHIDTADFYISDRIKLGLGSSAAVTSALTAGLHAFCGGSVSLDKLFLESLAAHQEAQGKIGSGIDVAASIFGGILTYSKAEPEPEIKDIGICEDLAIIPVWSGSAASTLNLVTKVLQFKKAFPAQYRSIIKDMSEISTEAIKAWSDGNASTLLSHINRFATLLEDLGEYSQAPIISVAHKKIGSVVRKYNGVYKPSGAGQGDLGLAFWKRSDIDNEIDALLKAAGLQTMAFQFGVKGIELKNRDF